MPGSGFSRIVLTILMAVPLAAQTESPAAGQAQPSVAPAPVQPAKPTTLTAEQRGDIFMARKMYREAIEQYRRMPETATILNKLGIAHHQMPVVSLLFFAVPQPYCSMQNSGRNESLGAIANHHVLPG